MNKLNKKIELWVVGLIVVFFIILIILISGVLRDAFLAKKKTPEVLRNVLLKVAEFPKDVFHIYNHIILGDMNKPTILVKHKSKNRFERYIKKDREALLILPRYDHNLERSVVEVIELNNFKIIHTYKHDILEMYKRIKNMKEFARLTTDDSPIRFEYRHPLILNDGSLISDSDYSPEFKIDFCSNLVWLNDTEVFHHSKELDHEGNIWIGGQLRPQSKYLIDFGIKDINDDAIIKINSNGEIIYKKSVIELLIENKVGNMSNNLRNTYLDPIHLNDIEPVFENTKFWRKGDLFLSIKRQSAIVHYRPSENKVINYIIGPFANQHDVDIISDTEISIFNNNNFLIDNEHSEVTVYNFETKKFRKLFNDSLKKENFKTFSQGLSQILEDGSFMVEEQNHGRIIFFNKYGQKEWEFVNKDINGDIGFISWSRIIEDKNFVRKFKNLINQKKCLN